MVKNDSEIYDEWVGSQTPEEFIENCPLGLDQGISEYVDDVYKNLDSEEQEKEENSNLSEIKSSIMRYIESSIKKEEIRVEFHRIGQKQFESSDIYWIEFPSYMLKNINDYETELSEAVETIKELEGVEWEREWDSCPPIDCKNSLIVREIE